MAAVYFVLLFNVSSNAVDLWGEARWPVCHLRAFTTFSGIHYVLLTGEPTCTSSGKWPKIEDK
jgi:hypothetical protein